MPAIDIVLPESLPPDFVFEQGHTYGHEPTFVYLNTGYPKQTTATVRIDAGDYPWNGIAQAPYCVAWTIPVIVANEDLRKLLHRLMPLFETVAAGLDVDPDPHPPTSDLNDPDFDADLHRPVGTRRLSPAATAARNRIDAELAAAFTTWPRVEVHEVNLTPAQEHDLESRITPTAMIYPDLADLAESLRATTAPITPGNYVVIPGLLDRLRAIQDRVRERELQRLEAIAAAVRTATADRDNAVVRISAWKDAGGKTSQRALAERTGLSHRGIGKILARTAVEDTVTADDLTDQPLPELPAEEIATLHLEAATPEQRYLRSTCDHPGARVFLSPVTDKPAGRGRLPVEVISGTDLSHYGEILSDWTVGTCGSCGAPVATFVLRTADGIWQTPWTLLHKEGEPEW
jgi:hypothetical protein